MNKLRITWLCDIWKGIGRGAAVLFYNGNRIQKFICIGPWAYIQL